MCFRGSCEAEGRAHLHAFLVESGHPNSWQQFLPPRLAESSRISLEDSCAFLFAGTGGGGCGSSYGGVPSRAALCTRPLCDSHLSSRALMPLGLGIGWGSPWRGSLKLVGSPLPTPTPMLASPNCRAVSQSPTLQLLC